MKSKDLIKTLQELDPSGETEVCVHNVDIMYIESLPAYYDGTLQVLVRDEDGKIQGAKYVRSGDKIKINTMSISDYVEHANECSQEINVDYSELSTMDQDNTKRHHQQLLEHYDNMESELELGYFQDWAKNKALSVTVDIEEIDEISKEFFKENLSRKDPIKVGQGYSYITKRHEQWDESLIVQITDGFLEIVKR